MVKRLVDTFQNAHPVKKAVLILWAVLFFGGVVFSIFFLPDILEQAGGVKKILDSYAGKGLTATGITLFILTFISRNFLFVPSSLFLSLAPFLFGDIWLGIFIAGIGTIISSIVGFMMARYYGKGFLSESSSEMFQILNQKLEERGVISIILLRIIPIFPADIINLGAGLSKVKLRDFTWATILAVWPDCIFYGFLGGSISDPGAFIYAVSFGLIIFAFLRYLKFHPEYKDLFILKLKKNFSHTKKKFSSFKKNMQHKGRVKYRTKKRY